MRFSVMETVMPKETFWSEAAVDGDGSEPTLTVTWGREQPGVELNGVEFDRSGLNRLVRTLCDARDATHGRDEPRNSRTVTVTLEADTSGFLKALDEAAAAAKKKLGLPPE